MYSIINKFFFWYNWVWWLPISKEHVYCGFELHEMAPFLPRVLRYQAVRRYRMDPDFLCKLIGAFPNQECVICLNLKKKRYSSWSSCLILLQVVQPRFSFFFLSFFFWGEGVLVIWRQVLYFFQKPNKIFFLILNLNKYKSNQIYSGLV